MWICSVYRVLGRPLGVAALLAGLPLAVQAGDRVAATPPPMSVLVKEATPGESFSQGVRAYRSGDKARAVAALAAAAAKGHVPSQWKLGKMYEQGDGVDRDPLKAFEYFRQVANSHAEDSPRSPFARLVANSFVELGRFFREGIPGTLILRNPREAFSMFTYAATYFGDAEAQYQLARMYLDGAGTQRSARRAMSWLLLASRKHHVSAQGELGRLLLKGDEDVRPQPIAALMWLDLARRNADAARQDWILRSYDNAVAQASEQDRLKATTLAESYLARADQ